MKVDLGEDFLRNQTARAIIIAVHFLAFTAFVLSLLAVQTSPVEPMGYFSFELLVPFVFWLALVTLAVTSVLSIESEHRLVLPIILTTMIAVRLPLFAMFKLPYGPDSYAYMAIIQQWYTTGIINFSLDPRVQYWPVTFLLLYAIRQLGIDELLIWSLGTLIVYCANGVLLYLVLRRLVGGKSAKYGILLISLAPTFNFYYFQIMAPQLIASSIFLAAILVLFAYERKPSIWRLAVFVALFGILLFTHHLTALLLAGYVFIVFLERPFARLLHRLTSVPLVPWNSTWNRNMLLLVGTGMILSWISYMATVARAVSQEFFGTFIAIFAGKISTYIPNGSGARYTIATYAFNLSSLFVYRYRLIPLAISLLIFFGLALRETQLNLSSLVISPGKLRSVTAIICVGFLILVSLVALHGLFLEVPRLFDLLVVFLGVVVGDWFVTPNRKRLTRILAASTLVGIMILSTTIGIAVQTSEFVYYPAERDAVLFVSTTYPNSTIYTDQRLVTFVTFFAPSMEVKLIPQSLFGMQPNQTLYPALVLISHHSIVYNQYRSLYPQSPEQVLQFLQNYAKIVYAEDGVFVYYLG